MSLKRQLEDAMANEEIVRIFRGGLEDGCVDAYIAGIGEDFFALEIFDKAARLDGYNCLRYSDISKLMSPAPHADFHEKALAARRISRRSDFPIDLSSLHSLLRSAGEAFPLVTVHHEQDDVNVCFIGKVTAITDNELWLLEVTPDGRFRAEPIAHALHGMTRVDFGGAYEEALWLVAGTT